ncbi:Outer membrane protein assembly factor BamE [Candidatus Magnetaquicoccaceae bacterium FCR-1]|uniref:Outer membrane protein assembly factor BamE n=1 Tax=Candidatus Magnetaquiglobus chichijimensis TaxID=3141448 RepID=A0ABQ0C8Q8_9PROT
MNKTSHRMPLAWTRALIVALALAGCQAQIHESGVILDEDALHRIHAGSTTRAQVLELLGPPTLVNPYRGNRWLYVQDRKFKNMQRTFARVANRVEITFDRSGVVQDVRKNFSDKPWDPTTLPEADSDKGWMHWLWDTQYAHPAVNPNGPAPADASSPGKPSAGDADSSPSSADEKKPWWKFWSRGEKTTLTSPPAPSLDDHPPLHDGDGALPGFLAPSERLHAPLRDPLAREPGPANGMEEHPDPLLSGQDALHKEAEAGLQEKRSPENDAKEPWWKFWSSDPKPSAPPEQTPNKLQGSGLIKE